MPAEAVAAVVAAVIAASGLLLNERLKHGRLNAQRSHEVREKLVDELSLVNKLSTHYEFSLDNAVLVQLAMHRAAARAAAEKIGGRLLDEVIAYLRENEQAVPGGSTPDRLKIQRNHMRFNALMSFVRTGNLDYADMPQGPAPDRQS